MARRVLAGALLPVDFAKQRSRPKRARASRQRIRSRGAAAAAAAARARAAAPAAPAADAAAAQPQPRPPQPQPQPQQQQAQPHPQQQRNTNTALASGGRGNISSSTDSTEARSSRAVAVEIAGSRLGSSDALAGSTALQAALAGCSSCAQACSHNTLRCLAPATDEARLTTPRRATAATQEQQHYQQSCTCRCSRAAVLLLQQEQEQRRRRRAGGGAAQDGISLRSAGAGSAGGCRRARSCTGGTALAGCCGLRMLRNILLLSSSGLLLFSKELVNAAQQVSGDGRRGRTRPAVGSSGRRPGEGVL